ncbi:hypothetical protein FRC19_005012 [Serendipita sp. 401]|nr:hypothetical protein FRC19_005012 [Serendipita sp. 401]
MAELPATLSGSPPASGGGATQAASVTSALPATELSPDEVELQSIFPDLDSATIHDCYVLCNRNVERTVEFLLGTDHNEISSQDTGPNRTAATQDDLDEQLARHLEQEELAAAASAWQTRQTDRSLPHGGPVSNPQPASGHSGHQTQQQQQTGSGIDDFNLPEQITKLAETGKRTFNTIFNKVRDKIKEFDAAPGENTAGSSSHQQWNQQQYGQQQPQRYQQQPQQQPHYFAPETPIPAAQRPAASLTTPYQAAYAPPTSPSLTSTGTAGAHINAASSTTAGPAMTSSAGAINRSGTAFLPKNPTPVVERPKPHPEEDLTESPFDDRNRE